MWARPIMLVLLASGLSLASAADLVLPSPAAFQLAFSPPELEPHAADVWHERLVQEAAAGTLGCRRHCERISRVFSRLTRAASRASGALALPWQLTVSTNPREAAWALAGGRLFFSEAFLDEFGMTDDELAFVMGHEMAHALLQHENETLTVAAALASRGVDRSVQGLYDEMAVDLGLVLKLQPALQAEEYEADWVGMQLAGAAGYKPEGALRFLADLAHKEKHADTILRTHPQTTDRYQRAYAMRSSAEALRMGFTPERVP